MATMTQRQKEAKEKSARYEALAELYEWLEHKVDFYNPYDEYGELVKKDFEWYEDNYNAFKYLLENLNIEM